MHGRLVQRLAVRQLDDLAEVHHGDAVRDVPDDREVVRDDHVRETELVLEVVQQVHHLRLDRHVQRRHRLVGDDQLRFERERPRDADALALPARELVRIAVVVLRVETHQLKESLDLPLHPALGRDVLQLEGGTDDRADRVARVQRGVRVLEDHLYVAAQRPHLPGAEVGDVPALELDLPLGRFQQPRDQPAHRRLAAARLAHHAEGLPRAYVEVEAVDGLDRADLALEDALLDGEVLHQATDPEQGLGRRGGRGRRGRRRGCLLRDRHFRILRLAHSFGAISSVQIRVRSSAAMWQAE